MPYLHEVIRNIASESKKVGYNPKTDTNWCHLPTKMRAECMKWMGFKDRCLLRRTSEAEKWLVDSEKYRFDGLAITFDVNDKAWAIKGERKMEDGSRHRENCVDWKNTKSQHLQCISEIFKKGVIEFFAFVPEDDFGFTEEQFLTEIAKHAPFRFKQINVLLERNYLFFLRNCVNLERVTLFTELHNRFPVAEVLNLPSVLNVKEICIEHMKDGDISVFLPGLVQKWIENDAEVGKLFETLTEFRGVAELIALKFIDRSIKLSRYQIRIRMNNPRKQILMRFIGSSNKYISCEVVPIDLPKEKYGIVDEWIDWEFIRALDLRIMEENPYNDI